MCAALVPASVDNPKPEGRPQRGALYTTAPPPIKGEIGAKLPFLATRLRFCRPLAVE